MRRRDFIKAIAGSAMTWPLASRAQQAGRLPTVGFLGSATPAVMNPWAGAFVQRLRELGWIEGRTVAIEYRWAEGRDERAAAIVTELVRMNVIVTSSTPFATIAKQATSVIPIVFASAGDPVGSGLVESLARPGGNVTGLSIQAAELASKRIELLREMLPTFERLAIMGNGGNSVVVQEMRDAQAAARALGLDAGIFEIRRAEDIAPTFDKLKGRADAVYVPAEPLANTNRTRINSFALAAHLPTMYGSTDYVEAGGLMSYGPNFPNLFRRRRQNSARDKADKSSGRAADKVRPCHQSDDRQGARSLDT